MAKQQISAIEAAMTLVEKVIDGISKPKKSSGKEDKKKPVAYSNMSEREFKTAIDEFNELTYKKFCKARDLDKDKKKTIKKYCQYLTTFLPVVAPYARYMATSTTADVVEKREKILSQFTTDEYISYVKNSVNEDDMPDGLEYYPLIVGAVYDDIAKYDSEIPEFLNDIVKIALYASTKTVNKLVKKEDIDVKLAMVVAMAVPTKEAFDDFPNGWVRKSAVEHLVADLANSEPLAKSIADKQIPEYSGIFDRMNIGDDYIIPSVFTLQSTDKNKLAVDSLTDWALNELSCKDDDEIEKILRSFCYNASKIENFDGRISFSQLPSDYISIRNAVTRLKNNKKFTDKGLDKYLK